MHHTGNLGFRFGFYRKAVTAVTHGNDKILQAVSDILVI